MFLQSVCISRLMVLAQPAHDIGVLLLSLIYCFTSLIAGGDCAEKLASVSTSVFDRVKARVGGVSRVSNGFRHSFRKTLRSRSFSLLRDLRFFQLFEN